MNLQVQIDELPPVAEDGGAFARMLDGAKRGSEQQLLDALDARRVQINLSNAELERAAGLTVGHVSKCMSPSRARSPTLRTLFALLDAVALSVVLVIDPSKVERISPSWRPRDASHVRNRPLSPAVLERARSAIIAELARRASRRRWASVSARDFMRAMVKEARP
jgi:transcriptional regulator with XRE-family HTH domain